MLFYIVTKSFSDIAKYLNTFLIKGAGLTIRLSAILLCYTIPNAGNLRERQSCGGINTNAKSARGMGRFGLENMSIMSILENCTLNISGQPGTSLPYAKSATTPCMTGTPTNYQPKANSSSGGLQKSMEWRTGFPDKAGWYDCRTNGEELRLCFRYCPTCGTYVWQDLNGVKIESEVQWLTDSHSIYP